MKLCKGSGGVAQLILIFDARWRFVINLMPGRFTPRKSKRYPLSRRLGGTQSRSESFGEEIHP